MQTIQLDIPLLIGGLIALLWLRVKGPAYRFQVACQFIGTFWAQYSFIVSWSLAKLVPFFAASTWPTYRLRHANIFIPFIIYTVVSGLISSLFWNIPTITEYAYGEGRLWTQLLIFLTLVATTRSYASAMLDENAVILLWKSFVLVGIVHGTAFLYQYLASLLGLPFIGISRAHGLTLEENAGDVAAFAYGDIDILRPGGLAGEPKTVVVLFGLVLLINLIGAPPRIGNRWIKLSKYSLVLSIIGTLGAFSTSGFIGLALAYFSLAALGMISVTRFAKTVLYLVLVYIVSNDILTSLNLPSTMDLLSARVTDRLGGGDIDPPVAASLSVLENNTFILLFGTGIGGGTFYIQESLNELFEYALAPNIGLVALVLEAGLIGSLLLIGPFIYLAIKVSTMAIYERPSTNWECRLLTTIGASTMAFMLTGSGIALGYPLAIGSVLGAINIGLRGSHLTEHPKTY